MGGLITREFKNKYNKKLEAYYKGEKYLENPIRTKEEIERWLPRLIAYTKELSIMLEEYRTITGIKMDDKIIEGGFILYDI